MEMIVFFKQKTAYEMRISDWSSDVCSSDLTMAEDVKSFGDLKTTLIKQKEPDTQAETGDGTQNRDAQGRAYATGRRKDAVAQIGRASCRERVCQYVVISVVAVSLQKKKIQLQKSSQNDSINNTNK